MLVRILYSEHKVALKYSACIISVEMWDYDDGLDY